MAAFPSTRLTNAFERRVARALAAHVAPGESVVVACSGGPDSMATLIAIVRSCAGAPVVAAHFDHRLRAASESEADRGAVLALAERLGVRCLTGIAVDPLGHSEAAARNARYGWLASACREAGARWCITGHTLDDQAETVLLRLARGSGLAGAAGMAASAPWPIEWAGDAPRLVRPLLGVRRAEVQAYLTAVGVEARADPTNDLDVFDRNRVRHRVLPELHALNPRVEEALARFAGLARQDDEALALWASREAELVVRRDGAAILVDRAALHGLPAAVAARIVRAVAADYGVDLGASQVASLLRLAGRRGALLDLGGGLVAYVDGAFVRLQGDLRG